MLKNQIIYTFILYSNLILAQKSQVFELDLQKPTDFQQIKIVQKYLETTCTIAFDAFEIQNTPFTAASVRVEGQDLKDNIHFTLLKQPQNGALESFDLHQNHESELDPNQIFISQLIYAEPTKPFCSIPNIVALPINRWILKINTFDKNLILKNKIQKIKLRLFNPPHSVSNSELITPRRFAPLGACDLPPAVSRTVWGSSWNLTDARIHLGTASYSTVTHLIVHHSAGGNTATDWNAVVAAIFDGHVNTNGWSDIAYNYLIAPNGTLYVGRGGGLNVTGAHFCGKNSNTMGVCLLGNYMTVAPPDTMLKTLEKILAWKCVESNINPTSTSSHTVGLIDNISGHRAGCATDCPGDSTFIRLGWLRQKVRERMALCQTQTIDFENTLAQMTVFPNPSGDKTVFLNIDLKQIVPFELMISDAQGKQVSSESIQPNQLHFSKTLNLNYLANGLYFCTIRAASFSTSEKIILGF
jgi:hypothetical protein